MMSSYWYFQVRFSWMIYERLLSHVSTEACTSSLLTPSCRDSICLKGLTAMPFNYQNHSPTCDGGKENSGR